MPDRPLIVTSDADLLDELLRLCVAAGVEASVAGDVGAARGQWPTAPLVILGSDLARTAAALGLPLRADLVLVGRASEESELRLRATMLGAEQVALLPADEALLLELLMAAGAASAAGAPTVAVLGGRGGAGASTLACGLAVTAAGQGRPTLLVDGDPLGGGLDLVAGCEEEPGLRWPDLVGQGTVSAAALRTALPRVGCLHVLSWDRGSGVQPVSADTTRSVLAAGAQGHQLVVVDLARHPDAAAELALTAADLVLIVVPAEVRAVAAAARLVAAIEPLATDVRLVTRGPAPSGLTPAVIAARLGLPLAGSLKPEPGLARGVERGEPPGRSGRGALAELCRSLLQELPPAQLPAA